MTARPHTTDDVGWGQATGALIDGQAVEVLELLAEQEIEDGDPARAVELCERLIAFYDQAEGADAESTMMWRGFLGRALNEARLHDRAEVVLRALVADRARVLGADDPATFVARGNLNRAIGFSGRTSEALAGSYELLADRERVLGPDDRDTLRSRGTISRLRDLRGERNEALRELEVLYADRVRALGVDHPDTVENHFNLMVRRAESSGDLDELDALIGELVALHGADHHAVLIVRSFRPDLLGALGLEVQAHDELAALYADRVRILGELHPSTLASGLALARMRWDRGEHTTASQMQSALVRVITATLGELHPLALSSRTDLLVMQADEMSDDEYWQTYGDLVADAQEVFDEASPGWTRITSFYPELFEIDDATGASTHPA